MEDSVASLFWETLETQQVICSEALASNYRGLLEITSPSDSSAGFSDCLIWKGSEDGGISQDEMPQLNANALGGVGA